MTLAERIRQVEDRIKAAKAELAELRALEEAELTRLEEYAAKWEEPESLTP